MKIPNENFQILRQNYYNASDVLNVLQDVTAFVDGAELLLYSKGALLYRCSYTICYGKKIITHVYNMQGTLCFNYILNAEALCKIFKGGK